MAQPAVLTVCDIDGIMHVHRRGCPDLVKEKKNASEVFEVNSGEIEEVVEDIWEDEIEMDDIWEDWLPRTVFLPCSGLTAPSPAKSAWDRDRLANCDDDTYETAVQVRELREGGMPWWQIAHTLRLRGHGPSARLGKTGAGNARRFWRKAWGDTHRSTESVNNTAERNAERRATAPGRPVFADQTPDLEIFKYITGRTIHWVARVGDQRNGAVGSSQSARVSPKNLRTVPGPKGRVLEFFEDLGQDKGGRPLTGPRRSVYLDRIERVGQ